MESHRAGEQKQFLQYFMPHQAMLGGYLLACTGDLNEAEDLLQEVACVLWEKFESYDPGRPFKHWMIGIARNMVLRWNEKKRRTRPCFPDDVVEALAATADRQAETDSQRRTFLGDCLRALPETAQEVLQLRYLEALPIANVAERMARKVGAVEMLLVRARRALRECVDRKLVNAGHSV